MAVMKAGADDFARMRDDYKKNSDNIQTMCQQLDRSLKQSVWEGQAQSRFENDWNSIHKPNLMKLKAALDDCHKEMEARRGWTEDFERAGAHPKSSAR